MNTNRKQHWEEVYENKQPHQVSWTQEKPETSLELIKNLQLPKTAKIIDVGGGDSKLADFLLEEGYTNITVLDISKAALERAKKRLGERGKQIDWIESDILNFQPQQSYDLWHDRAAFHFLTTDEDKEKYKNTVGKYVTNSLVIGTFSTEGPKKCSGLNIQQYSEQSLLEFWSGGFSKIECRLEDHKTPFDTIQNFLFCSFRRNI